MVRGQSARACPKGTRDGRRSRPRWGAGSGRASVTDVAGRRRARTWTIRQARARRTSTRSPGRMTGRFGREWMAESASRDGHSPRRLCGCAVGAPAGNQGLRASEWTRQDAGAKDDGLHARANRGSSGEQPADNRFQSRACLGGRRGPIRRTTGRARRGRHRQGLREMFFVLRLGLATAGEGRKRRTGGRFPRISAGIQGWVQRPRRDGLTIPARFLRFCSQGGRR